MQLLMRIRIRSHRAHAQLIAQFIEQVNNPKSESLCLFLEQGCRVVAGQHLICPRFELGCI